MNLISGSITLFKRLLNVIKWEFEEYLSDNLDDIENVYDNIANKEYEKTIKYRNRLDRFKVVFEYLPRTADIVIDLGCGTGVCIDAMISNKINKIIGVDISKKMLNVANERFKQYKNIEFIKSDFISLNFKNDSFDMITISNATRFIPKDYEDIFLKKLKNWIKKDGYLIVFIIDSNVLYAIYSRIQKYLGIPRYTNVKMHFKKYFIKKSMNYFNLYKCITLSEKILIKTYAIILLPK